MSEDELHQWMIDSFGPYQGEMAWQQLSQLPPEIREQIINTPGGLPDPKEVHSLMDAFSTSGLGSAQDINQLLNSGPINIKLATSIAHNTARENEKIHVISAVSGQQVRSAASEANLWLDSVTDFDPPEGTLDVLTCDEWVGKAMPKWTHFAAPVAESMNKALAAVFSERLGGEIDGQIAGVFAGPVPMPLPDDLKDPGKLITILGNTSYAMQIGQAGGRLARNICGGFDQGIALLDNPAGTLIPENIERYADELKLSYNEVLAYLALVEEAHARLFANVPWLMPQFDALIDKYARGITIDLDAMEEQLREVQEVNPDSIAGAVDLSKVGMSDTPEQREALHSLENLLAFVEGWVDCIVWRAGMAHIPHIDQLREMQRRERAAGGPSQETFETLLGLELRPKKMREAAELWETITLAEEASGRDRHWSHPDMLPTMPDDALAALSEKSSADSKKFNDDLMELLDSSPSDTPDTSNTLDAQDNTAGTADDADTGSGRGAGRPSPDSNSAAPEPDSPGSPNTSSPARDSQDPPASQEGIALPDKEGDNGIPYTEYPDGGLGNEGPKDKDPEDKGPGDKGLGQIDLNGPIDWDKELEQLLDSEGSGSEKDGPDGSSSSGGSGDLDNSGEPDDPNGPDDPSGSSGPGSSTDPGNPHGSGTQGPASSPDSTQG